MTLRIEHRLGVPAPAHVVWEVLGEITAWPKWCAMYPHVDGVLRIGAPLTVTERIDGREANLTPKVVDWVPDFQILWTHSAGLGTVRRLRYFEVEALSETGCIFANGEIWSGWFGPSAARRDGRARYAAFETLGESLKTEVARRMAGS